VKQRTNTYKEKRGFAKKTMIDDVNFDVNNNPTNTPTDAPTKAVSHSKVHAVVSVTPKSNDSINGYRLMDVSILSDW